MVCLMSFIMTIRYVGFVDNFLQIYLFAILRSFFFAWFGIHTAADEEHQSQNAHK